MDIEKQSRFTQFVSVLLDKQQGFEGEIRRHYEDLLRSSEQREIRYQSLHRDFYRLQVDVRTMRENQRFVDAITDKAEEARQEEWDRMYPWILLPWIIILAYVLFRALVIVVTNLAAACARAPKVHFVPVSEPQRGSPFVETNGTFQNEAYVSGSDYVPCKIYPAFQCGVYHAKDRVDGQLRVIYRGCAFWAGDYLWSNLHVVGSDPEQVVYLVNQNDETKIVELKAGDFEQLGELDAVAIPHEKLAKKFNVLGLRKATAASALLKGTQIAKIHSRGAYTMGVLSPSFDNYGSIIYAGSSTHGYSGAPYFNNNMIYGLHVGSCQKGVGYDMAYLVSIADKAFKVTKEDSWDDFLADVDDYCARTKKKIRYQQSSWDPSEWRFELRGYIHTFNLANDDYKKVTWDYFEDWADSEEVKNHRKNKHQEENAIPVLSTIVHQDVQKHGLHNDDVDGLPEGVQKVPDVLVPDKPVEITVAVVKEPLVEVKQVFQDEPISEPSVIPTAEEIGKMTLAAMEERFKQLELLLLNRLSCQVQDPRTMPGPTLTPAPPAEVLPNTSPVIKPASKRQRDLEKRMLKQYGIDLQAITRVDGQSTPKKT